MNYIEKVKEILASKIDVESDLLDLYTLLALVKGTGTTQENVHDAWGIWKNRTNSNHKSLIVFSDLSKEIQELDREYADAIKATMEDIFK